MVERIEIDKIAICGEAGVVAVVDMGAFDLVASAVGALSLAARLVVSAFRQQFVANMSVVGDPHADIGVGHHFSVLSVVDRENIGPGLVGIELPIRDGLVSVSNQ